MSIISHHTRNSIAEKWGDGMHTRTYTTEEREQAILLYAELDDIMKVSRQTGINPSTLSRWMRKYAEQIASIRQDMSTKMREKYINKIVNLGLENSMLFQEEINRKIKDGSYSSLYDGKTLVSLGASDLANKTTTYLGTMYDKYRLETGKSTSNVGVTLSELIDKCSDEKSW